MAAGSVLITFAPVQICERCLHLLVHPDPEKECGCAEPLAAALTVTIKEKSDA